MGNHPNAKVCGHGYEAATCFKCQLESAYARGFAEAVERAAKIVDETGNDENCSHDSAYLLSCAERAIRALSPKPAESGEKGSVKTLTMSQGIKLASIAVHAEEMLSIGGHDFDRQAILGLLQDPEVRAILDAKENAVFLPVKRTNKKTKR